MNLSSVLNREVDAVVSEIEYEYIPELVA